MQNVPNAAELACRLAERCQRENPCAAEIRRDEPMAAHTTFKTGGAADCYVRPQGEGFPAFAAALLAAARAEGVPLFVLGGGANIVVADRGLRGIVLDTSGWAGLAADTASGANACLAFRSGTSLDNAAELAAQAGLSGLEFFAGMPGSVGGAVWMNARCYGRETADALLETEVIDFAGAEPTRETAATRREDFAYKRSPFQGRDALILAAAFRMERGEAREIRAKMAECRRDRAAKGHYASPSAGSVFKNSRAFGKPTGKIIDELGLRGLRIGGAQVAPWHGNFIINTGGATAQDIRSLADEVAARVKAAANIALELEILFVGDW